MEKSDASGMTAITEATATSGAAPQQPRPSAEDTGAGVFLHSEGVADRLGTVDDSPAALVDGRGALHKAVQPVPQKANLRHFLEKLARRRRRITCTSACRKALEVKFHTLSVGGRVPCDALREMLRKPPQEVPPAVLRDLVEVSRAYDGYGDGHVDALELLDCALELQPLGSERLVRGIQVVALLSWFFLAPLVYCFMDGWRFLDAVYLTALLLTTVGTGGGDLSVGGDVVPETIALRFFTAFYALVGVGIIAWIIVTLVASVVLEHGDRVHAMFARSDADLIAADGQGTTNEGPRLEDLLTSGPSSFSRDGMRALGTGRSHDLIRRRKQKGLADARDKALECLAVIVAMVAGGTCLFYLARDDQGSGALADAIMWSAGMCTTIGAIGPRLGGQDMDLGTGLTFLFLLIAVPGCGFAIFEIGLAYIELCSACLEAEVASRALPTDTLIDLDANGAGVDKVEFLCAMLMALDKVCAHDLWQVLDTFESLDVDGSGTLDGHKLAALRRAAPPVVETAKASLLPRLLGWCPCFKKMIDAAPLVDAHDAEGASSLPAQSHQGKMVSMQPFKHAITPSWGSCAIARQELGASGTSAYSSLPPRARPSSQSTFTTREVAGIPAGVVRFTEPSSHSGGCSVGEAPNTWRDLVESRDRGSGRGSKPLVEDMYEDGLKVRQQLDEKGKELVEVLQSRQQLEESLRQVVAERQVLHGEVRLLQHVGSELQVKVDDAKRRQEDAEQRSRDAERHKAEAEQRAQDALRRCREAEQRTQEAEHRAQRAEQLRADAEARASSADVRAQDAERECSKATQRLIDAEQEWQLVSAAKARELEVKSAEMDMRRQGEIRSALLELQALAQGQQALRNQVHRVRAPPTLTYFPPPPPSAGGSGGGAPLVRSGQQPWELWERASLWARDTIAQQDERAPRTALLSGRVKEQVEFLDQQMRDLESRHIPDLEQNPHLRGPP